MQGPLTQHLGNRGAAADASGAKSGALLDHEALAAAHVAAVAGACMAIGFKHAGTGSAAAQALLSHYMLYLLEAKNAAADTLSGGPFSPFAIIEGQQAAASCISTKASS